MTQIARKLRSQDPQMGGKIYAPSGHSGFLPQSSPSQLPINEVNSMYSLFLMGAALYLNCMLVYVCACVWDRTGWVTGGCVCGWESGDSTTSNVPSQGRWVIIFLHGEISLFQKILLVRIKSCNGSHKVLTHQFSSFWCWKRFGVCKKKTCFDVARLLVSLEGKIIDSQNPQFERAKPTLTF